MSENELFPVSAEWAKRALVDEASYQEMYRQSIDNPEEFWGEHGKRIDWITPYTEVKDVSYDHDDVHIRWYHDGTLNASVNCLDRHLEKRGDQVAIIWEGDEPSDSKTLTYRELYEEVCRIGNEKDKPICLWSPRMKSYACIPLPSHSIPPSCKSK